MKTICVKALSVMHVTAFCGGAFGAEYCRPTGELQEKAQALADCKRMALFPIMSAIL